MEPGDRIKFKNFPLNRIVVMKFLPSYMSYEMMEKMIYSKELDVNNLSSFAEKNIHKMILSPYPVGP